MWWVAKGVCGATSTSWIDLVLLHFKITVRAEIVFLFKSVDKIFEDLILRTFSRTKNIDDHDSSGRLSFNPFTIPIWSTPDARSKTFPDTRLMEMTGNHHFSLPLV